MSFLKLTHDCHQVTELDPSSPWGYQMMHAALHKARDFDSAIQAHQAMLSKMKESPHPDIQCEFYPRYQGKDESLRLSDSVS